MSRVHSRDALIPGETEVAFSAKDFRTELAKIMPGYRWTVRKGGGPDLFAAEGIQSSGFNRLSTLSVVRRPCRWGGIEYEVKSSGFGTRAKWLHTNADGTLARALRGLQQHYEAMASSYRSHAACLQNGRKATTASSVGTSAASEPNPTPTGSKP